MTQHTDHGRSTTRPNGSHAGLRGVRTLMILVAAIAVVLGAWRLHQRQGVCRNRIAHHAREARTWSDLAAKTDRELVELRARADAGLHAGFPEEASRAQSAKTWARISAYQAARQHDLAQRHGRALARWQRALRRFWEPLPEIAPWSP